MVTQGTDHPSPHVTAFQMSWAGAELPRVCSRVHHSSEALLLVVELNLSVPEGLWVPKAREGQAGVWESPAWSRAVLSTQGTDNSRAMGVLLGKG